MLLLKGITGFVNGLGPTGEEPDGDQFRQICYAFILQNGGKVISFTEPKIDTNYYKVEIFVFEKHHYLLLNAHYPFLAIASTVECFNIEFVDEVELMKIFTPFYRLLSVEELNEPLRLTRNSKKRMLENENDLEKSELAQLIYWQEETVGEVIFNCWD